MKNGRNLQKNNEARRTLTISPGVPVDKAPGAFSGNTEMDYLPRKRVIHTTLGDLIAALTEEAFVVAEDENEVNALVADILSDLLSHSGTWH
jgi:ABC-type Fe2+-enterobactin transport system substrate-binding protein